MPPKAKNCPSTKILNPHTGRCVNKDGAIGKQIQSGTYKPKAPLLPKVTQPPQAKPTIKYPHLVGYIRNTLVYGDTKAYFISLIDKDAVMATIVKVSEIMMPELIKILKPRRDGNYSTVYSQIRDLITLSCPWPGFIKKPHMIKHLEDYSHYGDVINAHELFEAYLKDNLSDQRKLVDLFKIFYDDPDYELD